MLKMNRISKLFNSLALVATLTVSTAVYAMEPDQEPKVIAPKLSFVIVNEGLMEQARCITRAEVLRNLNGYSDYYFDRNSEMEYSIDGTKKINVDKLQYNRNIHYFNENFLSNPDYETTLNKDILALLKDGINPTYCGYESAFHGVATALAKGGITLEALVGKTADPEEVVKKESTSSEALEKDAPRKHRHCIIS